MKNFKKKKIGLVLAGGGTKGAYQVGVWKALKEMKINVIAIVGTSIGAINGALMLQDDIKKMEDLYKNITVDSVLPLDSKVKKNENMLDINNIINLATEYIKQGGISNSALKDTLLEYLNIDKIYNSKMDFGLVTYSFNDEKPNEIFKKDIPKEKMVDYLLASSCLPVFKPHVIDDEKYLDGGIHDNMPTNMLIKKGYKNIIVVDVNGFGVIRNNLKSDVFVKMIAPSEKLGGTLEFSIENIEKNMVLGYLDTLKEFNVLNGNIYYFKTEEFVKLIEKMNLKTILGLEYAAKIYELDKYKIYNQMEFLEYILKEYELEEKKFEEMKDALNFDDISENIKDIKKIMQEGIGLSLFIHLIAYRPALAYSKVLLKYFEEYILAAFAIIELKNLLK